MALEAKDFWSPISSINPPKGRGQYGIRKTRGFTGKSNGKYYYRGQEWHGPTNLIGRADLKQPATRHES